MKSFVKVGRSFLSLYFLIVVSFITASWLLDEVWRSYLEQDIESYTGYKTMLHAVEDYIKQHPELKWEEVVYGAGKKYGLPLKLKSLRDIEGADKQDRRSLQKGNTYVYYDDEKVELHHLIEGTNTVISLGPTKMPTRPRAEAFIRAIILLFLAVLILFWLWPISKDLDKLRKATDAFGEGNFSIKAPEAKSEMMASMVQGFNLMASRIARLVEAHKELTNAVSHELRTPLARSKFALQMLSTVKDEEKQAKYINQIESDIHELEDLVNELLVYAALDSEKPELSFQYHSINSIVEHQINLVQEQCENIYFKPDPTNSLVRCDNHFIERALSNYITNAIKYGSGEIKISVVTTAQYCEISVEDNGSGVSDELKGYVFDAFTRADQSRNRETGGFGLGLAIVKRVMEWHNGVVKVEDSHLGGARFVMRWSLNKQR